MEPQRVEERRWSWQRTVLVVLIYAALAIVMTWPIADQLGSAIPGSDGDAWVHLWTFNWIKDALSSGQSPYYTNFLYYPEGTSLIFHNIAWVNIAIWLPLQALFDDGAAYSLIFLAVLILNGFSTFLLAREETGSEPAAFTAGLVVAFWPYTLSNHNHPNLIFIAWIPLALLYLKRFFDRKQTRDAFIAALFVALVGLTRWQLLVMGGFIIALYILYRILSDRTTWTPRTLGLLLAAGLLSLLIMTPLLAPVVIAQLNRDDPNELFVDEELGQTDLLAYLVPNSYHPLWGGEARNFASNFDILNQVLVPFIGFSVLLLAVYGTVAFWPQSLFWLLAALVYIILALGPDLRVNGQLLPIPLPYQLVDDFFIIKIIRSPDRLNVLLSIPMAMLVALGVKALLGRVPSRQWAAAALAILTLVILAEYIVRYPTMSLDTPEWFDELAKEPGQFGIAGIPMFPRANPDKAFMRYQLVHGKPIVEGHVSRLSTEAFNFINRVPFLSYLRLSGEDTPDPDIVNVAQQLRLLSESNIRYLILDKAFLSKEEVEIWKAWLIKEPFHEDGDLVVFQTDLELGRDFALADELLLSSDGRMEIGLIHASITPTETVQGDTLQVEAKWAGNLDINQDLDACVSLINQGDGVVQRQCQSLSPQWPTSKWQADELVSAGYDLFISPYLNTGFYTVTLSLAESDGGLLVGHPAPIGNLAFTVFPRKFAEPEQTEVIHATWDEVIALSGYELLGTESKDILEVTLDWQALQRMDTSFTNFLHLVDPESGQILAQADVIPRGWSYPTNWWEQGELVEDTIQLYLESVPSGEYELYVGWYDIENGERLPVSSKSGELLPDKRAFLARIEHEP